MFQIRVMITSLRCIVTSLTPPPSPQSPYIYTWAENLPSSHFQRAALMHTCPGEKKSCLSLYVWIRKTSTKRSPVNSYVLVTFCDWDTLRAAWVFCASSALSANLSSVFTKCHSTHILKTRNPDKTRYPNISLVESPIRIQKNNNNKHSVTDDSVALWIHSDAGIFRYHNPNKVK